MSRLATSFVLGYHGCDLNVAEKAIRGNVPLIQSARDFDWLGPGAYFWESDPQRALEWAHGRAAKGDYKNPTVIGAVIDLGNCLDLMSRKDLELVKAAHQSFVAQQTKAGLEIPKNKNAKRQSDSDRLLRYLDCAVIKHLHAVIDHEGGAPFDTVRGMFTEGQELYPGCGFKERSHVQIAVRTDFNIKGLFFPRMDKLGGYL